MPQLPPSSDFRLRPALRDFAETSRRDKAGFGFNSKASNRAVLPDRRDKPVAGALAIFGIAGQVAPQNFFLVEQSENEDWDHERNHGQRDERAERQRQPEPKEEGD